LRLLSIDSWGDHVESEKGEEEEEEEEMVVELDGAAHDARPSAANVEDANSTLVTNSSKIWC
jgi:hypothetical protein